MSNLVTAICQTRKFGSAPLKAVAMYMADRASDDGSGIWTSKAHIADDTELSKRTVQNAIKQLLSAGLVFEVGQRRHQHGYTVEYSINISAVKKLPSTREKHPDTTGAGDSPVQEIHPTGAGDSPHGVQEIHPNHPLTTHEPPIKKEANASLSSADDETAVPDEIQIAVDQFNRAAEESGWPVVRVLSKTRRSALAARLRECGGLEGWAVALAKAQASPHCCGQNDRGWVASFDFITRQSSFAKLMEGNYDNRNRNTGSQQRGSGRYGSGTVDAFAEVARRRAQGNV